MPAGDGVGHGVGEGEPGDAGTELRLAGLTGDLRRRLRPACHGWSEAEFEALVDRLARIKLRWADTLDLQ
jgi:hypothetical protein